MGSLKYSSEGNGFRHLIDVEAEKKEVEDERMNVLEKKIKVIFVRREKKRLVEKPATQ